MILLSNSVPILICCSLFRNNTRNNCSLFLPLNYSHSQIWFQNCNYNTSISNLVISQDLTWILEQISIINAVFIEQVRDLILLCNWLNWLNLWPVTGFCINICVIVCRYIVQSFVNKLRLLDYFIWTTNRKVLDIVWIIFVEN